MPRRARLLQRTLVAHPVAAAFAVALVARLGVAGVVSVVRHGSLFLDDATYFRLAQAAADGRLHSLSLEQQRLYDNTGTLLVPITWLYEVLGPSKLVGQCFVALLGATAAALTARLALEVVGARWALIAGLGVALLPSQVLWSSIIMKDAAVWVTMSGLAVVIALAARSTGRRLAGLAAAAVVLFVLLRYLRWHTLEIALIATVIASLFSIRERRGVRVGGTVAMLVCIPLMLGMGPAGATYLRLSRTPAETRVRNAAHAATAVDPEPTASEVTYLPTGAAILVLRPWPWERATGTLGVALARAETVLWYPLVLLAVVGLTALRGRLRTLAFPLAAGTGVLVLYALSEGNIGTAYRHRGELVWIVILLATLGAERAWGPRRALRSRSVAAGRVR